MYKLYLFTIAIFLFALAAAVPQVGYATIGTTYDVELQGWAWSSTIGWISLSCTNTSSCGSTDYRVTIATDGTVSGYAWSSNIGWIKFGGLSGFPSGSGTTAANAAVTGTFPNLTLTGWARACAGTLPGDCSSMTDVGGGWDGWISLGGNTHSITFDATGVESSSYAWGGPVVGWIVWEGTASDGTRFGVTFEEDILITAFSSSLSGPPPVLGIYPSVPFSAQLIGLPDGVTVGYEIAVDGVPDVTGTVTGNSSGINTISDSVPDVPYTSGTAVLQVDMPVPGSFTPEVDEVNERTLTINTTPPPPVMTLEVADNEYVIRRGGEVEIEWEIEASVVTVCELRGLNVDETITVSGAPGVIDIHTGSETVTDIQNSAEFTLLCDTGDEVSITVEVIPDAQEV